MDTQKLWYCDNIDLYKILCPPKLRDFEDVHCLRFNRGDFIYFERDRAQKVFLVSKGKVKISTYTDKGEEIVKAILSKGEIFGEMAILGELKRREFAVAFSKNTAICPVKIDKMYDLMRKNERFSTHIYKIIGFRIRKLERRLEMILFKDAMTRLTEFISELAEDYGQALEDCILIKHPYTQNDIANLIGIRRETANHLFHQLKEEEKLDYKRYRVQIFCPEWKGKLTAMQHSTV